MIRCILFCLFSCSLFAESKVVLISGSTGGVGEAAVQSFHERGWIVFAGYREKAPKRELHQVYDIPLDVTKPEEIDAAVAAILRQEGRIDALVNNAGYALAGVEEVVTIDEARHQFEVNFFGALGLIQAVLPSMREKKSGHIINVSSTSGFRALPGLGLYAASKFALEGLSESLAATLSPWNIRVSIVEPGMVKNDFIHHYTFGSRKVEEPLYEELMEAFVKKLLPLVDQGQPCEEIGALIATIAEDPAAKMRYQTSAKVEALASKKLSDISGEIMRKEQESFFQSLLQVKVE